MYNTSDPYTSIYDRDRWWWTISVFPSVDFHWSRHLHLLNGMKNVSITITRNTVSRLVFHLFRELLWHRAVITCFDNTVFLMDIRAKAEMQSINAARLPSITMTEFVLLQSLEFTAYIQLVIYIIYNIHGWLFYISVEISTLDLKISG